MFSRLNSSTCKSLSGFRLLNTADFSKKAFKVLGVQQIAIGGLNKAALANFWTGVMGVPKIGTYVSEKENVDEDILTLGSGPLAVELDIMQPIDPTRAPKVHVPALNHIGLWVDDLDAAYEQLTAKGVRFTPGGIRKGASGHNVCFVHPKGNEEFPVGSEGVLLELVQAPAGVIEEFSRHSNK